MNRRQRTHGLQVLAIRTQASAPVPAPIRMDCKDGKCGQCHSCRNTKRVPVMIRARAIKTTFVYPPIPDRNFDWCATNDN